MQILTKFLSMGVVWTGTIPGLDPKQHGGGDAAAVLNRRPVKQLLRHAADRLNAGRLSAGLLLSPQLLTDRDFAESAARDAIRCLRNAGLIQRERQPKMRNGCESTARTLINPALIRLAVDFGRQCELLRRQGKREAAAIPARIEVSLPMTWTPDSAGHPEKLTPARVSRQPHPRIGGHIIQIAGGVNALTATPASTNTPNSTPPSGEPTPARVSRQQHPELGGISIQNLDGTTRHAPPAQRSGGEGPEVPDPSPPAPLKGRGGVSIGQSQSESGSSEVFRRGCRYSEVVAADFFQNGHFYDHFESFGANVFFEWLEKNGARKVYINGQPRKKNGERGAPVGGCFGFKFPYLTLEAVVQFENLQIKLVHLKKKRVDLITWADDGRQNLSKTLLIDDLDLNGVSKLKSIWDGPGCILETSPDNFQAILITKEPLDRPRRSASQRTLLQYLGGDPAAASPVQPHRFPGSPNHKFEKPFFCLLTEFFDGTGTGIDGIPQACPRLKKSKPLAKSKDKNGGLDNSSQAFGWTIASIRNGLPEHQILAELSGRFLNNHDPLDWPQMTVFHAREVLAGTYKTGSGSWSIEKKRRVNA